MLITDPNELTTKHNLRNSKYFSNGIIFDTCVLFVYLLDKYTTLHSEKRGILKRLNIKESEISCLNTILKNFSISKIIITPHVLSEFINRIRNEYKEDYKGLKRECLIDLKNFEEIFVSKNDLLIHKDFIDYGNDISLVLATEQHLKNFKYGSIASFDGKFMTNSYQKSSNNIIAFDLRIMHYFFE